MQQSQLNPILRGFHPDPSIVRVGDDYYIAVSTFEWYPGVMIYHSTDLQNWRLTARPLNRKALLDMTGEPDSCGVWAPCLSYSDGRFYLAYTDVKRFDGNFKDTHNYLTSCDTIDGQWDDPIYINSSGFDPSLYHDRDGRKWWLNMVWDHRPDRTFFQGIRLQEYCPKQQRLLGEPELIFEGSELGFTEGPHLYFHQGYYYLLTAEGGTGYDHACTMARSKQINGPYHLDPNGPIVTAKDDRDHPLQRNGHGGLVQSPDGNWYLTHLTSRPLANCRSPLGRETAIEAVEFTDAGWFRLKAGGHLPELVPQGLNAVKQDNSERCEFDSPELPQSFHWLRTPPPLNWLSLEERPGYLRLKGRESLGSWYHSALVARRQQSHCFSATTQLEFQPADFQQQAGLVCYYNSTKFHYLHISHDQQLGRVLDVMSCLGKLDQQADFPRFNNRIQLPESGAVWLRATVVMAELVFDYSLDGENWQLVATLDYSVLSDEAGKGEGANFTGAFVGVCCQDLDGRMRYADFSFFDYQEYAGD
ncbi:glycoside hydrolase family 43 protein [Paraferrimonas sedimenticola]|uniref:Xylan 1,4-beta-xylosidase n=1 Tax=Paraferrimonas sedimenticola TaxID=375674 RepID=A0AA37W146_9GAMM|nr:glycoside hydrolase family 43 protein [Paraferrimonas sedimenticola]GLP95907.1 xylan 1,4-beta-xylosidase [Paraferrimonas sedimenticola]